MASASLSIYRGQSRRGIGEGQDNLIAQGEQYLAAHPALLQDGDLLAAIRPWMSLDSDPADHRRLDDLLEGWSCLRYRNLQLVVRLVSAGTFGRRAAYFAHGRAWPVDTLRQGVDPGLHLGRSEVFEAPWRDDDAGVRVAEPAPALVRPEQIAAERPVAALFLGHYLQALVGRYPLIIAVPVSDFRAGSPLHALVSFSRAALPADLKPDCRIRVYSRLPELFLKHLQANLMVVPEEVAGDALGARRGATLLDRQGETRAGRPLEAAAVAYAEAVVERAVAIPAGLTGFSERFGNRRAKPGLPGEGESRTVQISYNLAYALSGSDQQRADLLRSYLPKAAARYGPGCDWPWLLDPQEWGAFPREALLDLVLLDSVALHPGTRELQQAVEAAVARLGLSVDARLGDWWNPSEPWKLHRLLQLLADTPPLVSGAEAVRRIAPLPIEQIASAGPASIVLALELEQGTLAHRSAESAALARLAAEPQVFDILSRAVSAGKLDTGWAQIYLSSAQGDALLEAAGRLLRVRDFWTGWAGVPEMLLDRLAVSGTDLAGLGPLLLAAGRELDPQRDLARYLSLAQLLSRIAEDPGTPEENALLRRLWQVLPGISRPADRELLLDAALGGGWKHLRPLSLVEAGELRAPWLADMADRLLASAELADHLATPALLELGEKLQDAGSLERLYALLDHRMLAALEETTGSLLRTGWWQFWRQSSALTGDELERVAMAWMDSDAWQEMGLEATYEAWQQAVADLPGELSGVAMAGLCKRPRGPAVPGPAIPPFEADQLTALAGRAADLGALAELAEAIRADGRFDWVEAPHRFVLRGSRFAALSSDAVGWLMERRGLPRLQVLDLATSASVYANAGHRAARALTARVSSVVEALGTRPADALAAAAEPYLWDNGEFLAALADWMARRGSVGAIGKDYVLAVDQHLKGAQGAPASYPAPAPRELVRELSRHGYEHVANLLLAPAAVAAIEEESLVDEAMRALSTGAHDDRCWGALAAEIGGLAPLPRQPATVGPHPLVRLAQQIRGRRGQSPEQWRALAEQGWDTFDRASRAHPRLLAFAPQEEASLPVFELAASMAGPGESGNAALRVIFGAAGDGGRASGTWWQSLLHGVRGGRHASRLRSADDREEVAVALIAQWVGELDRMEQQVFWSALEKATEATAGWGLPAGLGAALP